MEAMERLRTHMWSGDFDILLDVMQAEANFTDTPTKLDDAALALNAFLHEVATERLSLQAAKTVTSIGIDFCRAVRIETIVPVLEKTFGGYAISWARGTFEPLKLGSPYLH